MSDEAAKEEAALNANQYSTKKTISQGMLDISLLTANASQLKYVLQAGTNHQFYELMLSLISVSLILQAICGFCLIWVGTTNINKPSLIKRADFLNNFITLQIFIISVVNVLIAAFGIEHAVQEDIRRSIKKQLEEQNVISSVGYYKSLVKFD